MNKILKLIIVIYFILISSNIAFGKENFFDEASKKGQLIIRDLPLRDPKNYLKIKGLK